MPVTARLVLTVAALLGTLAVSFRLSHDDEEPVSFLQVSQLVVQHRHDYAKVAAKKGDEEVQATTDSSTGDDNDDDKPRSSRKGKRGGTSGVVKAYLAGVKEAKKRARREPKGDMKFLYKMKRRQDKHDESVEDKIDKINDKFERNEEKNEEMIQDTLMDNSGNMQDLLMAGAANMQDTLMAGAGNMQDAMMQGAGNQFFMGDAVDSEKETIVAVPGKALEATEKVVAAPSKVKQEAPEEAMKDGVYTGKPANVTKWVNARFEQQNHDLKRTPDKQTKSDTDHKEASNQVLSSAKDTATEGVVKEMNSLGKKAQTWDSYLGTDISRLILQLIYAGVYFYLVVSKYPRLDGRLPTEHAKALQSDNSVQATMKATWPIIGLSFCCTGPRAAHTFEKTDTLGYWPSCVAMTLCPCLTLFLVNSFSDLNDKLGGEKEGVLWGLLEACCCSCCLVAQDAETLDLIMNVETGCCSFSEQPLEVN